MALHVLTSQLLSASDDVTQENQEVQMAKVQYMNPLAQNVTQM